MEGSLTAGARRIVTILAFLGLAVIFVSGLFLGLAPEIISAVGGILAAAAWVFAIATALRARQLDWVGLLLIALVIGALLALGTLNDPTPNSVSIPQTAGLACAFMSAAYGALGGRAVLERGIPTFCGVWALLTLVLGGTLVGGAIGTNIGAAAPYITTVGFHLYAIAGMLAAFTWVVGVVVSFRTGAWGWFALVLLLPAIGALMFGLFGPTRQDVLMAHEHVRQRRAVGLR